MTWARGVVAGLAVSIALVLQVSVLSHVAFDGIVPDLCLLVVVAAALARGPEFAMVLGFAAGALLDLAPPADHVAGRWALALVVVGYVAGRVRQDSRSSVGAVLATVAASSFVGISVFAISGALLGEGLAGFDQLFEVIGVGMLWDLLLTPLVLPALLSMFGRLSPERAV